MASNATLTLKSLLYCLRRPAIAFLLENAPLPSVILSYLPVQFLATTILPYAIGKEDLLEQCRNTYKPLCSRKRLIVPGQVAREFAKNRAAKITELYQQLSQKQVPSMNRGKYPLLSSLEQYKEIVRLEEEIDKKLEKYKQDYKRAINEMLSHIQEWRWNDPVTQLYTQIFDEDTVLDLSINEEELKGDLAQRQLYNIPPSYKDRAKDDNGIGDLLIWHTILEVGKTKKKSVIFVTGDEKSDWYLRSEGRALYPRYELVDEFRRHSEGQTFHIVKFSHFLELFGASEQIVKEVQKEETLLQSSGRQGKVIKIRSRLEAEAIIAVTNWLQTYRIGASERVEPNPYRGDPALLIYNSDGPRAGVDVNVVSTPKLGVSFIRQLIPWAADIKAKYNEAMIMIVLPSENLLREFLQPLIDVILTKEIPDGITFIIGTLRENQFEATHYIPPFELDFDTIPNGV